MTTLLDFDKLFVTRNYVGKPQRRNEDEKFVKGEAVYVDDVTWTARTWPFCAASSHTRG